MTSYHYAVHGKFIEDLGGIVLADDAEAAAFGGLIIQDMMRVPAHYDGWTVEIRDGGRLVGCLPFEPADTSRTQP